MAKKKRSTSVNKARLTYVGENLMIQEIDKDGEIINELSVFDILNDYLNTDYISLQVSHQSDF